MWRNSTGRPPGRPMSLAAALMILATLAAPTGADAAELIPSVGVTRAVHEDEAVRFQGGLAIRGRLAPLLNTEIGVTYRKEERLNGGLDVRMWPVTASVWLAPLAGLYAGGGVGWYFTTLDYSLPGFRDETRQKFGLHVGGGIRVPLTPILSTELSGRYAYVGNIETRVDAPRTTDPDFWSVSLGLAIGI